MTPPPLGLVAALGVTLACVWLVGTVYGRVRGLRLRRVTFTPGAEVPLDVEHLFAEADLRLLACGFVRVTAIRAVGAHQLTDAPSVDLLYRHPDETWAWVHAPPSLGEDRPIAVDFVTRLARGGLHFTLTHDLPGRLDLPDGVVRCLPELSLGRRLAVHRFELDAAHDPGAQVSAGALLAEVQETHLRAVQRAVDAGELEPDGDRWRLTPSAARRFTRQVLRGFVPGRAGRVKYGAQDPQPYVLPPSFGARVHRELEALTEVRQSQRAWLAVFVGTLVLFVAPLLHLLEPPFLVALVLVALLHEGGHWAAMKAFGWRDPRVFFLPFLGAVTSGRRPEASVHQQAAVVLAGPVPGLLLGLALVATMNPIALGPFWHALALLAIGINLFNLLPFLPLDGGRLVQRVLLTRMPRADAAFAAASALAFVALAVRLEGLDLVFILAPVLLFVSARRRLKVARALEALDEAPPGERDPLVRIYAALGRAGLPASGTRAGFALARDLEERLVAPPATRRARLAWLLAYVAFSLGAAALSAYLLGLYP
jgi:Zn-dependent protease